MLLTFNPDIVHIHTCWNWHTSVCVHKALQSGCALLFSPYGELSSFNNEVRRTNT